ncbi:MAG: dCTP deaminase [Nitrospinaceae bacterium]
MILSRPEILEALLQNRVSVDPPPEAQDIDTTSIDLRMGRPLWVWKAPPASGPAPVIDLEDFEYHEFSKNNLVQVNEENGGYYLRPGTVYLASTHEKVRFPAGSRLAGRVEGKSQFARLGLTVHMTAPMIHCGTGLGPITLEMYNHGPYTLRVVPGQSRICQLIFEEVTSAPEERTGRTFTP